MSDNKDKILDTIQKLMARADSTTFEGEAAACLNRARDLLAKNQLSMEDVEMRDEDGDRLIILDEKGVPVGTWQPVLAKIVAQHCACEVVITRSIAVNKAGRMYRKKAIEFIGRKSEMTVMLYMFRVLHRQMRGLLDEYTLRIRVEREEAAGSLAPNQRQANFQARSYALGILDRLTATLAERQAAENNETALALVTPKVVGDWMDENVSGTSASQLDGVIDAGSYWDGQRDGATLTADEAIADAGERGRLGRG